MTALVEPSVDVAGPTLGAVVDALGLGVVRVLCAPRGLDVPVGEPVVHDPTADPAAERTDVLLAVGVEPQRRTAVDLVSRCGELGLTAVLVKSDGAVPAPLVAAAEAAGVALLVAPRDASWGQLHVLLRSARSASSAAAGTTAPLGDLFGLADAVSALVGGAVTVEDDRSVVLAYSSTEYAVDQPRRDTILGRRVPPEWLARLQDSGVFRRLRSSDEVVRVELDGITPRLAVAVRAGGELLGSLWVVEGDRPLGAEAERALREAASMAALHLLRARSGDDLERRRAGEQLRAVLQGRLPAALLAELLQAEADTPLTVVGLELADPVDGSGAEADRAVDVVVLSCRAFRRRVVAAALDRTVWAVVAAGSGEPREVTADLAGRVATGLRVPVRGVGAASTGVGGVLAARDEVELGLRVLAGQGSTGSASVDELRAATVLLQLADLARERPGLLAGKVRMLQESDARKGTSYVDTLRAFLDAFGDVRVAADAVGVHPNTFRYRLRRLCELAALDLDDPVERLVVQLQLHLLTP